MGNIGSRSDDGSTIFFKDQSRFSISSLVVSNSKNRTIYKIGPNAFPASRVNVKRDIGDESPVEFVQDFESSTGSVPSFLLRLNNEDELHFTFTIVMRQSQTTNPPQAAATSAPVDITINGLTFVFASNQRDLDQLVTREFHADPNIHKNNNVQLVGSEYNTAGSPSIQFTWTWRWQPPKIAEDKGGGWRNTCTFVEYDQRAHRFNTLSTFSFYVHNVAKLTSPQSPASLHELLQPPRLRVPSSQSVQTIQSDSENQSESRDIPSPIETDVSLPLSQTITRTDNPVTASNIIDVSCQRPQDDISAQEDGPLFRATMKALEQKTGTMKLRMKKVLRKAEAAQSAQVQCNEAVSQFMDALREAGASNANAVQPALEHYFEKIARQILLYESQNTFHLQKLIIDPLSKIYNVDIKQADMKRKDFEDESKDYYAFLARYLGQRQESLKEKKRIESDSKYESKRRTFELRRFDYSSFMQDLHGGRKDQEVLSHLTKYADTQTKSYLATAKKIEDMVPQLEALIKEVRQADKEFQFQRTEREEKRRTLEKNSKQVIDMETSGGQAMNLSNNAMNYTSDSELGRTNSNARNSLHHHTSLSSQHGSVTSTATTNALTSSLSLRSVGGSPLSSPPADRFKGFRDLEDRNQSLAGAIEKAPGLQRKEGLLWSMSRPGSHVDPRGLNKQAWHKFWIVLDQGKLSEYSNWKEKLDLHMEPIDLRLASVREARNAERRFCFEVITPTFKRVYQATSEEDMTNWISSINNALQSAFEGQSHPQSMTPSPTEGSGPGSLRRDIGSVLTGKSPSYGHNHHHSPSTINSSNATNNVFRRTTVGARPSYVRTESGSYNENPTKLLQEVRERDQGNQWCADCNSTAKTEWVSINLGIVLCIECSGIHRSLGTHVSKVRSLTLDTVSFTADTVEILMQIGNRISNAVWEATLDPSSGLKPGPQATRDHRLRFITEKYVDRLYVQPIASGMSHYGSPDETLLASVKKNDIQQVLYALASGANPSAHDKSRATPAIFLALAAADPASPQATTAARSIKSIGSTRRQHAFPIAELLLQNGAEMPKALPAFPLSDEALQFYEQRGRRNGDGAANTMGGDTLTALPSIKSPSSPGERVQEKLQKRVSAGARFGGRVMGTNPAGN